MGSSLFRWLLHRDKPKMKPLCQRASWYEFAGKMHEALARDMRILLDEAAPEDFYQRPTAHITQVLAWHEQRTVIDEQETQPLVTV